MLSMLVGIMKIYPKISALPQPEEASGLLEVHDTPYNLTIFRPDENFATFTHPKDL